MPDISLPPGLTMRPLDPSDSGPVHALTAAQDSSLATDSRTGALSLYERVGMVVDAVWVNRAIDLV